jgi:hypothetical protein
MGNMTDLFIKAGETRIRAQIAGRIYLKEGGQITVRVDESNFCIFGGEL